MSLSLLYLSFWHICLNCFISSLLCVSFIFPAFRSNVYYIDIVAGHFFSCSQQGFLLHGLRFFFFWFEIIYHLCGYFTAYMNNSLLFMNTNYIIYPLPFCYVECFLSCFYSHDFGSTSLCSTRFTQSVPFLTICMVDYILYYF